MNLKIPQFKFFAFWQKPHCAYQLVATNDHQILKLVPTGKEAIRIPLNVSRCAVAFHVLSTKRFTERSLGFLCKP